MAIEGLNYNFGYRQEKPWQVFGMNALHKKSDFSLPLYDSNKIDKDRFNRYLAYDKDIPTFDSQDNNSQDNSSQTPATGGSVQSYVGKGLAAASGIFDIINKSRELSNIANTDSYMNDINQAAVLGKESNYGDFETLSSDYDRLGKLQTSYNYNDIRGLSDGQKVGGVASAAASGAMTGLQVGGPWGALVGGVVGLGSGIAGVLSGDKNARMEKQRLEDQAYLASQKAIRNLNAAHENLLDYNFRQNISNRADYGGSIKRARSIRQYADSILNRSKSSDVTRSSGIIRRHCKGGTMIRIKR